MFTHLHTSSGYSFKYGSAQPDALVARAADYGMSAIALTDRDGLAGAIRFAQSCEAHGIAPILGVNLSFIQKKYRVTLLAQSGKLPSLYRLMTAINRANNENLLTYEILEEASQYSSELFLMHGYDSQLAQSIALRKYDAALSIYNAGRDLFAEQIIECTSHLVRGDGPLSTPYAARALGFARDHKLPAVLTNAARMLGPGDGPLADVLDAARLLVPLHQNHVERRNSEGYLKSESEMRYVADEISRMAGERNGSTLLATTESFAQRCQLSPRRDIGIGGVHLPESSVVGAANHGEMSAQLRERAEAGLSRRYSSAQSVDAAIRLEEELATIRTLGFESYFLTVADIADMARSRGIRVAARGSGAGSLICYLLGISGVEPLSQGLLMERFCSTLRGELPDIDIDVESHRRLEIYDAIFERYGPERTATVAMVDTYRARHAIRDVGAALGISPMEIDLIAKSLPHIRARNIGRALENLPELKHLKLDSHIMKVAINLAERIDGLPRHLSMHPCAIVLSDAKLLDVAPILRNPSNYPMVYFDKDDVEAIGLLKLDVLGVRMQSAISYALSEIERVEESHLDIDQIPLDDSQTFDLIKSTRTLGIFQVESPGQRELVGKFAPSTFTDLIIDISLFRPGPVKSDMITPFINTRHGHRSRSLLHPRLDPILTETEGVVVFHEQVIRLISAITGASLAESDERRRQLGSDDGQKSVLDWFYPTALAQGFDIKVIDKVWDVLRAFASFGFCKAHAAAFALPTYQSAWLKAHHTAAFIAGALTHDPGMYPKRLILDEARQWGIEIEPIDINLSDRTYRVEKIEANSLEPSKNLQNSKPLRSPYRAPDGASTGPSLHLPDARGYAIRMALSDIQGISDHEISTIIQGRPYLDLADFVMRSGSAYPTTQSLILVGAFDQLHHMESVPKELDQKNSVPEDSDSAVGRLNRRDLLLHAQDLYTLSSSKSGRSSRGGKQGKRGSLSGDQLTLGLMPPPLEPSGLPELTQSEKIFHEVDLTGMDISHHMLEFYGDFLNHIGAIKSSDLIHQRSGATVLVAGVKVALQTPPIRSGRRVIFLTLDDGNGCNDITFFEDAQESSAALLYSSWLFLVRGEVRRTGPRGISIRATQAWELGASYAKWRDQSRNLNSRERVSSE
jgi:error-prone DNA polymerase